MNYKYLLNEKYSKVCITFAWAWWCWKSPIANYLSINFWLPILNSDNLRSEIIENLWYLDEGLFRKVFFERLTKVLSDWFPIILDLSVDREWSNIKLLLEKYDYKYFIISFNLTKNFLSKLYFDKGYENFVPDIDRYLREHEKFLDEYKKDIYVEITDDIYINRLEIILKYLKNQI